MIAQAQNELQERLFELKQRFIQKMPERIQAIESTLKSCVDGGNVERNRLERQFHTLAGTAGTYQLNSVAAAAFEGEEACSGLTQKPLDMVCLTGLRVLVDHLRSALAADAPEQWSALTVLTPVLRPDRDSKRKSGVFVA